MIGLLALTRVLFGRQPAAGQISNPSDNRSRRIKYCYCYFGGSIMVEWQSRNLLHRTTSNCIETALDYIGPQFFNCIRLVMLGLGLERTSRIFKSTQFNAVEESRSDAVRCSPMQWNAVWCSPMQSNAVWCSKSCDSSAILYNIITLLRWWACSLSMGVGTYLRGTDDLSRPTFRSGMARMSFCRPTFRSK